jgi:hypothetical protein
MNPQFVVEIKPHRYGWSCAVSGKERVFVLRPQAIQFAQERCATVPAEIRVQNRQGALESTLRVRPGPPSGR